MPQRVPILQKIYEVISKYILIQNTDSSDDIPIYQTIKNHKQIHKTGNHTTMPSFMIYISPLKSIVPNNTTYSLPQERENVHFFLPLVLPTPPHLHLLYRFYLEI